MKNTNSWRAWIAIAENLKNLGQVQDFLDKVPDTYKLLIASLLSAAKWHVLRDTKRGFGSSCGLCGLYSPSCNRLGTFCPITILDKQCDLTESLYARWDEAEDVEDSIYDLVYGTYKKEYYRLFGE